MSKCKRCGLEVPYPKIRENESDYKQCYYCDLFDDIKYKTGFNVIRKKRNEYDCLIGISGGLDSSLLLYLAVKKLNLKVLAIHYDNGFNTEIAENNISKIIDICQCDFIRFKLNIDDVIEANQRLLNAEVPDADIHNDIIMAYLMNKTALDYRIKVILNGHNYRTEGTSPIEWSYMDALYLSSITGSNKFMNSILFQIRVALAGIRQIRLFYYFEQDYLDFYTKELLRQGIKDYKYKHAENYYTAYISYYYLPNKFNIDKTLTYKAAMKRSLINSNNKSNISDNDIDDILEKIYILSKQKINPYEINMRKISIDKIDINRSKYKSYRKIFKKYNMLFYILTRLKFLPDLFYKKYCR